jgi:hypothetical protein
MILVHYVMHYKQNITCIMLLYDTNHCNQPKTKKITTSRLLTQNFAACHFNSKVNVEES